MNIGKAFERDFSTSTPKDVLLYRIPDQAQSFGGGNLRFSAKSPFDFLMWNPKYKTLYALELKTVKGKSISFEREKEDNGVIHKHQIDSLNKWFEYGGIICGFIIEFREIEKTIFISINEFNKLSGFLNKKSFNINDLKTNDIKYFIINQNKKRTRFSYDINSFLENIGA